MKTMQKESLLKAMKRSAAINWVAVKARQAFQNRTQTVVSTVENGDSREKAAGEECMTTYQSVSINGRRLNTDDTAALWPMIEENRRLHERVRELGIVIADLKAQRKPFVGLTDEEFHRIYDNGKTPAGMMELVESALREKNSQPYKPLTEEQITECWEQMGRGLDKYTAFARAIEAKLKEKNT